MARITLGQFKEVTQQADDDAKIRLGSTDCQPKTASQRLPAWTPTAWSTGTSDRPLQRAKQALANAMGETV